MIWMHTQMKKRSQSTDVQSTSAAHDALELSKHNPFSPRQSGGFCGDGWRDGVMLSSGCCPPERDPLSYILKFISESYGA